MKKEDAIKKYGEKVVELARDMHETDFGKVVFEEDVVDLEWDIPLCEEDQIEYLEKAKF